MFDAADRALLRRLWALTWPLMLANALELAVGLVDLLLVRPLGPAATAAVGVGRQVTFVVEAAAAAITAGVLTLISRAVGARSSSQVWAVVQQSAGLVLLLSVPVALAGYFSSGPLLLALQVSEETLVLGQPYLQVYFAGLVFSWGHLTGMAIFRGAGDVKTPLKLALASSLLNIGLDYLFIHGGGPVPAFGVMGAALGTVLARFAAALAYLILLGRVKSFWPLSSVSESPLEARPPFCGWRIDWNIMGRILRIGVPMALANMVRHGSRLVFLAIVGASALGTVFQAAVGLGMQVRLLGILPALAFQTALATLVGQALGSADAAGAQRVGLRGLQFLGLVMVLLLAVILALADPLAALFIDSPEAALLGARVLRWFALAFLFSALSIGMQGALLGAGDTAPALRYTLLSEWGLMIPLAYFFLVTDWWFPRSLLACWALAPAVTLVFMYRRWRGGHWNIRNESCC